MFRLLCLLFTGSLVLLLAGGAALSIAGRGGGHLLATYTNGNLSVTIPYRAAHSGKGKIVAEVVDPEDHVLGKVERSAEIKTITVSLRLRAKYPIKAHTFQSRVFEYYDPEVSATAHPVALEVTK